MDALDRNRHITYLKGDYFYLTRARFELLLFDMGWTKLDWPAVVPA
jgi:hypothetical protein